MMNNRLLKMSLLAVVTLVTVGSLALAMGADSVGAGALQEPVGVEARGTGAVAAIPLLQTDTLTPEPGSVPTEGVEDTLPWWVLALPLVLLVVAGLFVWRRPAMERTQTADPIAPPTTGTGMHPITERRPDTEESDQFEERD